MRTAVAALAVAVVLAGCGSSEGETRDQQGSREFGVCMKQADRIGQTQGAAAASAKRDDCVSTYANGTY